MQIKHFDDLGYDDCPYGSVWIEVEDLDCFRVPPASFDEEHVARLPESISPNERAQLFELDHFFLGCRAVFQHGSHRGLAYIRSSDNVPYHVDIFHQDGRCSLPSSASEALTEDVLESMSVLGAKGLYPFVLEYDDLRSDELTGIQFTFI